MERIVRRDLARDDRRRAPRRPFQRMSWRRRAAVRIGQARPPLRPRDPGRDRGDPRLGVRRLRGRRGGPLPERAAGAVPRRDPEARGHGQAVGGEGARVSSCFARTARCSSPIAKFLSEPELEAFREPGIDGALRRGRARPLPRYWALLRLHLGRELGLVDETPGSFTGSRRCPLLDWDEDEQRWTPSITRSRARPTGSLPLLDTDPGAAQRWSPTTSSGNGIELGRGLDPDPRARAPGAHVRLPRDLGRGAAQASSAFSSTRSRWARLRMAASRLGIDRLTMALLERAVHPRHAEPSRRTRRASIR